jgi:phenylalanyl-tRNA synthetase beta chain
MICALFELGLEEKNEENYNKGIAEIDTDLAPGTDANIYLGTDDTIYELDVHKHRNNDCYYHIGFAYEIASILSKKVTLPEASYKEDKDSIEKYVSLKVVEVYPNGKERKQRVAPLFVRLATIGASVLAILTAVLLVNYYLYS